MSTTIAATPFTGRKARKTEPVKDPCHELA